MKIEERNNKLVIVDFDEFEAYRIACKVEKDGMEFYQNIHDTTQKIQVKETMRFLIEEEKKHLQFFEGCLAKQREEKEDVSEDIDLLDSMDAGVFEPYQSIRELGTVLDDFRKAVTLGIRVEIQSIRFYEQCSKYITSKETKKELQGIIEEEKRHKDLLERIIG